MSELPEAESAEDIFEPNDTAKKNRRNLYLAGASVLAVVGCYYLYSQFGASPAQKVDETRQRVQATAEIVSGEEAPEVVNGDLQRQLAQLQQQNTDLQTQNVQLAGAAKQYEEARMADRADAARAISALEDEMNRTRTVAASGPAGMANVAPGAAGVPQYPGGMPTSPLASPAGTSGDGAVSLAQERPRRTMSVIRTSAASPPRAGEAPAARPSQPPTDFANNKGAGQVGAPQPGAQSAAYFSGKLQSYATGDFVPPNAYARAKVLVGVDSSTSVGASADPKPVLLRIQGDAVSVGVGGKYQSTKLRGCVVNGAAYGELSSEKVYVKLQRITCPAGDKKFSVATVEGYVSQRGKAGVRGQVVERAGGLTMRAAVAGTLQGLGGALSQNFNRTGGGLSVGGAAGGLLGTEKLSGSEIAQGAAGSGVGMAASMLAEYYIKRAEQYQPVIEMPTGIEVEIVFLSGFQVRGE